MNKLIIQIMLISTMVYALIGVNPSQAADTLPLSTWSNYLKLAVDHSKVLSTLTDFPVLVHLSSSSGINKADVTQIFQELGENRKKIAFTTSDRVNQCLVEIEKWDNSRKEAWLWVKVPELSCTVDTDLYLYYDKNQPDNTAMVGDPGSEAAKKVWDNHYRMVLHLDQAAEGKASEYLDATGNGNNGTGGNGKSNGVPVKVGAVIGDGQSFDGVDDYIEVADSDDLSINTTGRFTVSVWISPAVENFNLNKEYIRWMGKGGPGRLEWQFVMYNKDGHGTDGGNRSQWISFYVYSPKRGDGAGGGGAHSYIAPGNWIYVTGATDMVHSYGFFNGLRGPTVDDWSAYDVQYANGSDPLRIGTHYLADGDWWNGRMDEIRISDVSRSNAWVRADYFSQSDELINYRGFDTQISVSVPISPLNSSIDGTINPTLMPTYSYSELPASSTASQSTVELTSDNARTFRIIGLIAILIVIMALSITLVRHYRKK